MPSLAYFSYVCFFIPPLGQYLGLWTSLHCSFSYKYCWGKQLITDKNIILSLLSVTMHLTFCDLQVSFLLFFFACYAFSLQVFENSFWAFSVNSSPACSHALEIQLQSKSSNIYHKTLFAVVCTSIVFNILHMLHYYFKHTTRIIISTQPSEQMSCGNVILEWISWGTTSLTQVKT